MGYSRSTGSCSGLWTAFLLIQFFTLGIFLLKWISGMSFTVQTRNHWRPGARPAVNPAFSANHLSATKRWRTGLMEVEGGLQLIFRQGRWSKFGSLHEPSAVHLLCLMLATVSIFLNFKTWKAKHENILAFLPYFIYRLFAHLKKFSGTGNLELETSRSRKREATGWLNGRAREKPSASQYSVLTVHLLHYVKTRTNEKNIILTKKWLLLFVQHSSGCDMQSVHGTSLWECHHQQAQIHSVWLHL